MLQKQRKQLSSDPGTVDFGYIEFFRKAMMNQSNSDRKLDLKYQILLNEVLRDFHKGSLWQIKHLIHIDGKPNLELVEPRWEIYKISLPEIFFREASGKKLL